MGICGEVALLIDEGVPEEVAWAKIAYFRGKMSKKEYERIVAKFSQKQEVKANTKSILEEKNS